MGQITTLTPRVCNGRRWDAAFQKANPREYEELVEVIRDFYVGGKVAKVFPSLGSLHRYLSGKDPDNKIKPMFQVSVEAFTRFAKHIVAEDQG
jgi:hypothetical protein